MAKIPIEIEVVDEQATQAASAFGGALGGVVKGIQAMTLAAKAFIATPIGLVLGALGLALGALAAFFKRSEEGQDALNKVMRVFNSILDNVLDVVGDVGEAIFKLTTEPIEGIKNLGDSFLKFVGNPLVSMVELLDDAIKKSGAFAKEVEDDIIKSKLLAAAEAEFDRNRRKFTVEQAKRQARIEELKVQARDEDAFTAKQRKAFVEEAIALTNEQLDAEIRLAKTKALILKVEGGLAKSDKEALDAEAEALAEVSRVEAKRFKQLKTLQMEALKTNRQVEKEMADARKASVDEQKLIDEIFIASAKARTDAEGEASKQIVLDIRKIADAQKKRSAEEEKQFKARQTRLAIEKNARLETVQAVADATALGAQILGEQTIAGIALAVATATADTFVAANKAMAAIPPPAGQIVAATIIAQGLFNVAQIIKAGQQAGAAVSSSAGVSSQSTIAATSATNFPAVSASLAAQQAPLQITSSVSVEEINDVNNIVTAKETGTVI